MANRSPKRIVCSLTITLALLYASADELPSGVPNPIGPDGKYTRGMLFTTSAYQNEAVNLILREANTVATELHLPEDLPIASTNVVRAFVSPFGYAYAKKAIGTITTKNYVYYFSKGNKFSYLEGTRQFEDCQRYQAAYTWPAEKIDYEGAYKMATQWLAAASMDVKGLNRDYPHFVDTDSAYVHPPAGKFVPVYYVYWAKAQTGMGSVASVRLFTPTNALLQLRVEDPKYILRKPLVFTNLAVLLSQTNTPARTNAP